MRLLRLLRLIVHFTQTPFLMSLTFSAKYDLPQISLITPFKFVSQKTKFFHAFLLRFLRFYKLSIYNKIKILFSILLHRKVNSENIFTKRNFKKITEIFVTSVKSSVVFWSFSWPFVSFCNVLFDDSLSRTYWSLEFELIFGLVACCW